MPITYMTAPVTDTITPLTTSRRYNCTSPTPINRCSAVQTYATGPARRAAPQFTQLIRKGFSVTRKLAKESGLLPHFGQIMAGCAAPVDRVSPNLHPYRVPPVHLVARPHAERLVERQHVRHRAGDTQKTRRMNVGLDANREILRSDLIHPAKRPADEVPLRRRQAAERFAFLVLPRLGERVPAK